MDVAKLMPVESAIFVFCAVNTLANWIYKLARETKSAF